MPDLSKFINGLKDQQADIKNEESLDKYEEGQQKYDVGKSPEEMIRQNYVDVMKQKEAQENPQPVQPGQQSYDLGGAQYGIDGQSSQAQGETLAQDAKFAGAEGMPTGTDQARGQWHPNEIYQDFLSKAGDNVMVGVGNMIGDFGNIAQYAGSALPGIDMYEGNMLSRAMQRVGNEISENNATYISPEMRSPEFKFSTFINPEFWSVHGAQFVPQLLEILATDGLANAAVKGVETGAKTLLREGIEEGAEALAKKGLTATTNTLRQGVTEVAGTGKGLAGKLLRDTGELTSLGKTGVKAVTGGLITNLRTSLSNAGEVYNTYKDIKDEQGNDVFTKEELGQMAGAAFGNNMQYMLADIASWGMTFGGGWNQMKGTMGGITSKLYSQPLQRKVIGGMFSESVNPLFKKAAMWGGKAVAEGMEETIQETWEEWSKFKAYKEKAGTWKGYNGVSQDYDGFWDYYESKDSESIRAISFGLGAAAGGVFNVKSLINKQADEAYKLYDRSESLKQVIGAGNKGREIQDLHIREQMAELVFEGKDHVFDDFIGTLRERGVVDEEQFKKYNGLFEDMVAVKNDTGNLSIKGKHAFMLNVARQKDIDDKIVIEKEKHDKNMAVLEAQLSDSPKDLATAQSVEKNRMKEQLMNLGYISEQLNANKVKILTGSPAKKVSWDVEEDENGSMKYVIKDNDAKGEADNDGNIVQPNVNKKTIFNKFSDKAKELLSNVGVDLNEFLHKEEKPQEVVTPEQKTQETDITQLKQGDQFVGANDEVFTFQSPTLNEAGTVDEIIALDSSGKETKIPNPFKKDEDFKVQKLASAEVPASATEQVNAKLTPDDSQTKLTPELYSTFVEQGTAPTGIINAISEKLSSGKVLTEQEEAVRQAFSKEVEANLQSKKKVEEEAGKSIEKEEGVSESEANYIKKAIKRKSRKSSLETEQTEFEQSLKDEEVKKSKSNDTVFDEDDAFERQGRNRIDFGIADKIKNAVNVISKRGSFVDNIKGKFQNLSQEFNKYKETGDITEFKSKAKNAIDNITNFADDYDTDALRYSQTVVVNERLNLMFPESGAHVTDVKNLSEMVGFPTMGYTLAGAIYIDANSWNQDEVFMHEVGHIYYQLMKNDPATNTIVSHAFKNKELLNKVLSNYSDQIYYKMTNRNGDEIQVRKAAIANKMTSQGVQPQEIDARINIMVKNGQLTEIPLEEQPIIREELFAFTVEGPLSNNYNKYFSVQNEPVRKFLVKNWWKKIKEKATEAKETYTSNDAVYLQTLAGAEKIQYDNAKVFILDRMKSGIKGVDLSPVGRAKYQERNELKVSAELEKIRTKLQKQTDNFIASDPEESKLTPEQSVLASLELEEFNSDDSNFFEVDRIKYVQKASQIVGLFAQNFNKVKRIKFYNANRNKPANWSNIPFFDKDKLQIRLYQLAKQSYSNEDFIHRIENSEIEELYEFNKFLDDVRPDDKMMLLSSMKFIFGNQSNVNSVIGFINQNGKFELQNNLNNKELSQVEAIQSKLVFSAGSYFKNNRQSDSLTSNIQSYIDFVSAAEKIRSGNYKQEHLYNFLKMFSNSGIDLKSIMEENRININGKNFTVDTVVNEVIKKVFTKVESNNTAVGSYNVWDPKTKSGINPILRTFVQSLVATNRKFTADFTVSNAEGNMEPIRVIDNFMTRELERMEENAVRLSRTEFLKKFGHITSEGAGARSNALLNYIFDQVNAGNKIDLNQFHGVKNFSTQQNNTIKNSNSSEQSVFELLTYLESGAKDSYMMETGRYADSPTSYMLRVPKVKLSETGSFIGSEFKFGSNPKSHVQNVFKTYQNLGGTKDLKAFEKMISNEINKEIKFVESNIESFDKIQSSNNLFTKEKLNTDGKNKVAEYVVNQIFNGVNFSEIFFPSFKIGDLSKRAKSGRSPGFRFGKNVQLEPIYFVDDMIDGKSVSDSGIYVLREDAERMERAGGSLMKLNKSYKILNTGVEYMNEKFANKNMFDKGYATILDDAVVAQNPKLKGLFELMKERRAQYVDLNGEVGNDLLNGIPTHFMYAAPVSSNKSNNFPDAMIDSKDNPTDFGQKFTLDVLNEMSFDEQHKALDSWYYKDNDFVGLSGDNFVVQQIMDKESYDVNTPVQMIRAMLTNASVSDSLELVEKLQSLISEEQQNVLEEYRIAIESNDSELLRDFIKSKMDMGSIDPLQRFLILDDALSMSTPALRELAKNTLSNAIRINGNKLRTPGGLAQAKAATYEKPYTINGSKNLAFYGTTSDGGHTKGEAVLPAFMQFDKTKSGGKGKLNARTYFVQSAVGTSLTLDILERQAKEIANKRGTGIKEVYNDAGVHIGWYAEGDTVIATRIPSHGPQTTGVFEVVDFDTTGAANVQLPSEFALDITGGDYDGDQFFIQHKGGKAFGKWNEAFDMLTKHWLSPQMASEVRLPIDFKSEAEEAVKNIESVYGSIDEEQMYFSPQGRRQNFNNTLISKGNIGVTANLHSLIGMLSAYETELKHPININGVTSNVFKDQVGNSRTIDSAKIFNIILDNAKYHYADKLGINEHTVSQAMILRNLGYSLTDIGMILNSEPVVKMNEILANNQSIYTEKKSVSDIVNMVRSEMKLPSVKGPSTISVNTNALNTAEQQNAVLELMGNLSTINEEIMTISTIMQGHNKLENNPFILNQQLDKFNSVMNNDANKAIVIPARLTQNPIVQNYLSVFQFNMETQQNLDPVYSDVGISTFDKITTGIGKPMSNQNVKKIHNDIEAFTTARLLGMNNIPMEKYQGLFSGDNSVFNKVNEHVEKLKADIIEENSNDVRLSISAFDNSLLFQKGLRISLHGNNKFISLNNNYFNENMSKEERKRLVEEFNALPNSMKDDLILYDLVSNNWKGPQSLFHLLDKDYKQLVSDSASALNKNEVISKGVKNELTRRVVQTNSKMFVKREYPFDLQGNVTIPFMEKNKSAVQQMLSGKTTIFRYLNDKGQEMVFHFHGWSKEQIAALKESKGVQRSYFSENVKNSKYEVYPANIYENSLGVVAIPDPSSGKPQSVKDGSTIDIMDMTADDDLGTQGMSRREIASDYYNYTSTLTQDELMRTLKIKGTENVDQSRQDSIYAKYIQDKKHADELAKKYNSESVKNMVSEDLINLYSGKKSIDGEAGLGYRDKIAYASVIRPVIIEIANRAGVEQKDKFNNPGYKGKDLGFMESYLMANNIPSGQPEIQALVRKMETEYRVFQKEKNKYVSKINKATEKLYLEQFGYNPNSAKPFEFLKSVYGNLFKNKEQMYRQLYGPLVEFQQVSDSSGRTIENMKYKTKEAVEAGYKAGTISEAQYEFYNTTREISEYLKPFVLQDQKGREDYIPHTAPAWLEIKARRGMLGLAVNSKTVNERIYDVRMDFKNPITGEVELGALFSHIENVYNTTSKSRHNISIAKDFTLLKRKAIRLAQESKNEDGTPLRISDVEAGSSIGDVFMDRFSSSRSISATDLPSLDLNKAFVDYTHSSLFNHGNENFAGMNKMLSLVDGILAIADARGDENAKRYVDKVWKEYFLGGRKQDSKLPNSSTLESFGITTDKVIDYLTKASLIYWLGWKGLVLAGGTYAIGNVLIGKYNNVMKAGGANWVEGEKRFWGGIDGFNILDPFKGVRDANAILKNTGFMDINVYDSVNMAEKSGIEKSLMSLALFPMTWSERWIQGVDFLGRLTKEEWNSLKEGNPLPNERMNLLENDVKISHGKGYQATDQRMLQMYSWGRNFLQFSRFIPTLFYDQFGKEDINIYGNKHMGAYTAVGKTIQKGIRGEWTPAKFFEYRKSLDSYERKRLDQGLMGFGFIGAMWGMDIAGVSAGENGFFADANPLLNSDEMMSKTTPPSFRMLGM